LGRRSGYRAVPPSDGRITETTSTAARLHDVRFRQLETGLPARFQTPDEIKKQRKIHDKLIEKGLQLIADSFLDQLGKRCEAAGVRLTRQLLEGINYEEIVNEVNRVRAAAGPDRLRPRSRGGLRRRRQSALGREGRRERQAGRGGRGHSGAPSPARRAGSTTCWRSAPTASAASRTRSSAASCRACCGGSRRTILLIRDDRPFAGGRFWCAWTARPTATGRCARRSTWRRRSAALCTCAARSTWSTTTSCFTHQGCSSYQASKVFKFEEQEELHNNIIDKGLLKLARRI